MLGGKIPSIHEATTAACDIINFKLGEPAEARLLFAIYR
jgi:hypothetical protein